jgi:hypothetical protein
LDCANAENWHEEFCIGDDRRSRLRCRGFGADCPALRGFSAYKWR